MAEDYYQVLGVEKRHQLMILRKPIENWLLNGIRTRTPITKRRRKNSKKSVKLMRF